MNQAINKYFSTIGLVLLLFLAALFVLQLDYVTNHNKRDIANSLSAQDQEKYKELHRQEWRIRSELEKARLDAIYSGWNYGYSDRSEVNRLQKQLVNNWSEQADMLQDLPRPGFAHKIYHAIGVTDE